MAAMAAPPATAAPSTVRRLTGSLGLDAATDGGSTGPAMLMQAFNRQPAARWSPRCQGFVSGGGRSHAGSFSTLLLSFILSRLIEDQFDVPGGVTTMLGPRMLFGAVVGGAVVYFFDPQNGARRRERLREWWEQN